MRDGSLPAKASSHKWRFLDSDSMIADQITVMNQDYASAGLQFVLKNTSRITNWNWFNQVGPSSSYQTQMKQQVSIAQSYSGMPAISSRHSSAPARRRS